ncbi:MAG: ParB/RepB/Spo0J family partition protein [Chloroflexota bacterium]|nr:ParB/RepB/Spo0J family partition protein [Chloroflexota bacterium]
MPSRPRGGLGRGLDALIPQAETPAPLSAPVDAISTNPYQPRASMDEEQLEGLADSIRENGLLQPLLVQRDGDQYRLIAGHRRLEAARMAGLQEVPIMLRSETGDNPLLLALVENLQRADLSPLDEAAAYRELSRRFGLSTEEIATRTGKSRSAVANSIRLLDLTPEVKDLLEQGRLSEGHARALLGLRDPQAQVQAAHLVVERGLNVRQTEVLVKQLLGGGGERTPRPADPQMQDMEGRFRDALGTKVSLSGSPRGGKITIHYYSEEELSALYEAIVGGE